MGEAYRADVEVLRSPWGDAARPGRGRRARQRPRRPGGGVRRPLGDVDRRHGGRARRSPRLTAQRSRCLVVDAISSLGATPLETDAWGLDVVVTGSQKALMTPPGLAFASVSERARERARDGHQPALLLRLAARARRPGEGPDAVHAGHLAGPGARRRAADDRGGGARGAVRAHACGSAAASAPACRALGLELFSPDRDDCSLVTAALWPAGIDGEAIRARAARPPRHHGRGRSGRARRAASCASARSARSRPATSCAAWRRSRWSCSQPATCSSSAPASARSRARVRGMRGPRHRADRGGRHRAAARGGRGRRRDRPRPRRAAARGSAATTRSSSARPRRVDAELIARRRRACAWSAAPAPASTTSTSRPPRRAASWSATRRSRTRCRPRSTRSR